MQEAGKLLIVAGLLALAVGGVLYLGWGPRVFGWVGRLPGDIRIERENFRFYFPLATCIVFSILLMIVVRIVLMLKSR